MPRPSVCQVSLWDDCGSGRAVPSFQESRAGSAQLFGPLAVPRMNARIR